jgi:uncharacterized protein YoaH (UPF0181 family)
MERAKVVERIRKCMALARSSNEHEAAVAMRQARSLMAQYRIFPNELYASVCEPVAPTQPTMDHRQRVWESSFVGLSEHVDLRC